METHHELRLFLQALFSNWAALFTGGGIAAVVAFIFAWREKPMRRRGLIILSVVLFGLASFLAWRTQYEDAQSARKDLDDRLPKLKGTIDQSLIGDVAGMGDSSIWIQVSIVNTGRTASFAEKFKLQAVSTNITINCTPLEFKEPYPIIGRDRDETMVLTLLHSDLIEQKAFTAIEPGHSVRGWAAFTMEGVRISTFGPTNFNLILSFSDYTEKRIYATNGPWESCVSMKHIKTMPGVDNIEDANRVIVR